MPRESMHRVIAIIIAITAVIQCYGIGERAFHATWQRYKFYAYSNDGHTTLSINMILLTFVISIITLIIGFSLYKKAMDKLTLLTIKYSSYSIVAWLFILSMLIISPFGQII